jgi:transcriptional regulator with XRE-family HTH domain
VIGARLRARREELGLLQTDVARETGIAQARISRVERRGSALDLLDLAVVLQLYGLPFEDLLGRFTDAEQQRINATQKRAEQGTADLVEGRARRRRAKAVEEARARLLGLSRR